MRPNSFLFGLVAAVPCVSARKLSPQTLSPRALEVNSTSESSSAAKVLADNLMSYYSASDDGVLPAPYYWWESGAMMTSMIQYWHYTGDSTYNDDVAAAIATQAGSSQDFLSSPYCLGNDDQQWWAVAAMTAAEYNFQAPSSGSSWLQLAENVFNDVQARWDTSTCNGGLHWQISPSSPTYGYKNSITNGLFFQLAARLARYTGDDTYMTWATNAFNWAQSVKVINPSTYVVADGADSSTDCDSLNPDAWSYNVGVFLYGAAVMLDLTGDTATWQPHVDGFISAAQTAFTSNGVMQETLCEPSGKCDTDQLSFKAYLSRWLGQTAALVPSTQAQINPLIQASAEGAIASCNGGPNQDTCGIQWPTMDYDGITGVGQQMSAMEVVQARLAVDKPLPSRASKRRVMARDFKA